MSGSRPVVMYAVANVETGAAYLFTEKEDAMAAARRYVGRSGEEAHVMRVVVDAVVRVRVDHEREAHPLTFGMLDGRFDRALQLARSEAIMDGDW